jgi:DME family drug/metabolite transporter
LLHLGVGISIADYFLYLYGLKTTQVTIATIIGFIEPLTASVLAYLLFDERLSSTGLLGAILLVGAMLIVWRTTGRQSAPATEL